MASLSSANRAVWMNTLENIGLAYTQKALLDGPPQSAAELGPDLSKYRKSLDDGTIVMRWGLNPSNAPAGASNTVLGYVKDVPEKGGVVLMLNGKPQFMSAQEYQNARKVGG